MDSLRFFDFAPTATSLLFGIGRCDILDFTPIWIDLSPVFPQDYIERFWSFMDWKLQSSCVNVVWSGLRRDEAGDFHIDDTRFIYADDLMTGLLSNGTVCACSALPLSHAVKAWMFNDANRGVFLIEGCKVGDGLSIVGRLQGTDAVVSNLLDLRVSSVEDMYEFISIRDAAENREFLPSIKTNQLEEAVGLDVFFIHGFNVDEPGARAWGAEVFKRLWQSGSNARFHMVTWRGDYNWTGISLFNALHYQHDAYFAQMTAKAFKYAVEKVQGDSRKRIVMGHSLGNMVVCEALRENLYTAKYFMFNAAVPSEAVDAEKQAKDGSNPAFYRYVPRGWRNYHFLSWASNWWRWFAEDDLDSRGKIGWPGRYEFAISNSGQPYNYYSKGDDIFLEASNPPWFAKGMLTSSSLYSWQKQETLKGTGQLGGTLFGGWSFHLWEERELVIEPGNNNYFKDVTCWYSVSDVNEMIANGTIVDTPVFNRDASEMFDHNASVDDQFLCLAKCVPAISTAIGGCAALEEENTDLNTMKYRNGWGRDAESGGSMPWKHSDLKDMAYFYVYKLYDEIVKEKGRLK